MSHCLNVFLCAVVCFRETVAFVQPSVSSIRPASGINSQEAFDNFFVEEVAVNSPDFEISSGVGLQCFFASMAFGFIFAFSGLTAPASAADAPLPKMCVRTEGCIGEVETQWNKAKFLEIDRPQVGSKYTIPTTGAGRYKLFGLDYASPVKTIPDSTDGTYPLRNTSKTFGPLGKPITYEQGYSAAGNKNALFGKDQEDKAFLERVKPLLGKNATITPTYSPFAPFDWGKTSWEMQGTIVNSK